VKDCRRCQDHRRGDFTKIAKQQYGSTVVPISSLTGRQGQQENRHKGR